MLSDKSVLITGGTGSLGQALVREFLHRWPGIRKLVVFSRDELKQYEMRQKFPEKNLLHYVFSLEMCGIVNGFVERLIVWMW